MNGELIANENLVQYSLKNNSSESIPSYDNHGLTRSPGALIKTGNVREYMTFPSHTADSRRGERGMIETREDT